MKHKYLLIVFLLGFCVNASAHEEQVHYDHISLSASASKEVPQDELRVTLYAFSESDDPQATADEVSERIHKALAILNSEKAVSTQTGSFSTHPVYQKQQVIGWRSRQSLDVKSNKPRLLSKLINRLQNYVLIENIRYDVSEQTRRLVENQLIDQAVQNFLHRARLVTTSLRREQYRLVDMNISTTHPGPRMLRARTMASHEDAAGSPPAIQAGKQLIQVNINGKIELQLKNK